MKLAPAANKLRGGYYTPQVIARFLADWSIRTGSEKVLEPSCGDGNIVVEAVRRIQSLGAMPCVDALEIDAAEAKRARARVKALNAPAQIVSSGDFFEFAATSLAQKSSYDVAVGNPPFIRYQDFPEAQRTVAFELMRGAGLSPSRLANSWLPFLVTCSSLLNDRGRLAMVVPAELFQVGYAAETRQFLATHFAQIDIIAFDQLVFPDIQQEVVLLLAQRQSRAATHGIRVHQVSSADDLSRLNVGRLSKSEVKPIDHASEKWTKYFLDADEIVLLRSLRERSDIPALNKFIDIDVGVVTGDNDFFVLTDEDVRQFSLDGQTTPLVGRSAALSGIFFDKKDLRSWQRGGGRANLFLPSRPYNLAVGRYVKRGETARVHEGYKCRIRDEWFIVPSVWTPDLFFMRQADTAPRMVANSTGATCTDTLHRGRLVNGLPATTLAAAFLNSLTLAASEVTGRSYGGGVMTYEPSEVERLPLPADSAADLDVAKVDALVREKKLDQAIEYVDQRLLKKHLGFTNQDIARLRGIWTKLRDRRRGRRKPLQRSDNLPLEKTEAQREGTANSISHCRL